jgi:sarcosine oxidase, subunit gamma
MREYEDLAVSCIGRRASLHLKSWIPGRSLSCTIPPSAMQQCRLLALAPGEWLLVSDTLDVRSLHEHASYFGEQGIAAVRLSPGLSTLQLDGPNAREVLAKSCGLDLHPTAFPVGTCTRTRLARLPVILDYVDVRPSFELYVGRSYLSYLLSWLNDASVGFTGSGSVS